MHNISSFINPDACQTEMLIIQLCFFLQIRNQKTKFKKSKVEADEIQTKKLNIRLWNIIKTAHKAKEKLSCKCHKNVAEAMNPNKFVFFDFFLYFSCAERMPQR